MLNPNDLTHLRRHQVFQMKDGKVLPPALKTPENIQEQRDNEIAKLMYDRFEQVNSEVVGMLKDAASLDQFDQAKVVPEPPPKLNFFQKLLKPKKAEPPESAPQEWGKDHSPLTGIVSLKGDNHLRLKGSLDFDPAKTRFSEGANEIVSGLKSGHLKVDLEKAGPPAYRQIAVLSSLKTDDSEAGTQTLFASGDFYPAMYFPAGFITPPPVPELTDWKDAICVDKKANTVTFFTNQI